MKKDGILCTNAFIIVKFFFLIFLPKEKKWGGLECELLFSFLHKIDALIDDNAFYPGAYRGFMPKGIQSGKYLYEGILQDIFRVGSIAQHPQGNIVHRPGIPLVQLKLRFPVAGQALCNQLMLGSGRVQSCIQFSLRTAGLANGCICGKLMTKTYYR